MAVLKGNIIAFALFAGAFALHVVGGATDQGWLFAIAVALIAVFAVAFPLVALATGRPVTRMQKLGTVALGAVIGVVLTASALWAANDRSMAWWQGPLAMTAVAAVVVGWFTLRPGGKGSASTLGDGAAR